jgi:hypothetical protein
LSAAAFSELLERRYFGEAWQAIEASSPALRRRQIAADVLPAQTRIALRILIGLRETTPYRPTHRNRLGGYPAPPSGAARTSMR